MRRNIVIGIILLIVIGLIFGVYRFLAKSDIDTNKKIETIIIGTSYWPGQYWIDVAESKGWFREAGVSVKTVDTQEDYYASIYDTLSGKINLQVIALSDVMIMNARGADLVMILPTDVSLDAEGMVAQGNIQKISDLKGKKIGVESGEAFSEMLLDIALRKGGLTRNEITIIPIPPERANDAFKNKEIDAVITWDPFLNELISEYNGTLIFSSKEMGGSISGLSGRSDFINAHQKEIGRIISVWRRTTEYMQKNSTEVYALVAAKYKSTLIEAEQMIQGDYVFSVADNKRIMNDPSFEYSIPKMIDQLRQYIEKSNAVRNSLDIHTLIDQRFLDQI